MANRYWVGGTENWNGTASTKWATTSGGAGGAAEPTASDDVFFDAASGTVTVTVAVSTRPCLSLNFSGFTGTLAGSVGITISGSMTLGSSMTFSNTGEKTFNSTSLGNTLTFNGKATTGGFTFNGSGGSWTIQDSWNAGSYALTFVTGTFDANDFNVTCATFDVTTTPFTLTMGNGTWNLTGTGVVASGALSGLTVNAENSTLELSTNTASSRTITSFLVGSGGLNKIRVSAGSGAIVFAAVTCNEIDFTGTTGEFSVTNTIAQSNIRGNLTFGIGMTVNDTDNLNLTGSSGTQTITTNGVSVNIPITINASGATKLFYDDFTSTRSITLTAGALDANNNDVSIASLSSNNSNVRSLLMGSGDWLLTSTGTVWNFATTTNLSFSKGTGTIKLTNNSASTKTFSGGGLTYYNVWNATAGAGVTNIVGSNTFNNFKSDASRTVQFTAGTTNTFATFTPGDSMTIGSITSATHTLNLESGIVDGNGITVSYSIGTPSNTWYAGATGVDNGNNTGWLFEEAPPLSTDAGEDQNGVPTMLSVWNSDETTPVALTSDTTSHRLAVDDGTEGTYDEQSNAMRDENWKPTMTAVSSVDGVTPVVLYANRDGALLVDSS